MKTYQWIRFRTNCGSDQELLAFGSVEKGVGIDG
jgi:hypothetical protein